eukprot:12704884-Ditylum_brightwellii.AAC.1
MGFILDKNGENVVLCPAMIGGADRQLTHCSRLEQEPYLHPASVVVLGLLAVHVVSWSGRSL